MPIISEINLSCLYRPVTAPGSDDDNKCSISTNPTLNVTGNLSLPRLTNLSGNASTDNSSQINTDSPTFEFIGKIQENGDGSFTLPNILQHRGITYLKETDNNQKMNTFFNKVRQWENSVSGDVSIPDPSNPVFPVLLTSTTVYTASQGSGQIAVNLSKSIECITCLNPCGIGNSDDCGLDTQCPKSCQTSLIMTDYSGNFIK